MRCRAKSWSNFLRIDENGCEHKVRIEQDASEESKRAKACKLQEIKREIYHLRDSVEKMPSTALAAPISHYDYLTVLLLLSSLVEEITRVAGEDESEEDEIAS